MPAPGITGLSAQDFRALFPSLDRLHWFATPASAPAARPIAEALRRYACEWQDGSFDWLAWETRAHETRALFGDLVSAEGSSITLLHSLAEAAATVAHSIFSTLPAGTIVLAGREFRSNLLPWVTAARDRHVIRLVAEEESRDWTELVLEALDESTVFVAISEVQSATGSRIDQAALLSRARSLGARVFLNLTQSAGVLQQDLKSSGVDFAACHGYKWLGTPRGATWLYVRPDLIDTLQPLTPNWKNASHPYDQMYGLPFVLARDARRGDCSLAWPSWVGAHAALELAVRLPKSEVERHCLELADLLRAALEELGFDTVRGGTPSHIVAVRVSAASQMAERLRESRIIATARDGFLRFGCHYYNSLRDVAVVLDTLELPQYADRRSTSASRPSLTNCQRT